MFWSSGVISAPYFYLSEFLEDNKDLYIDTMRNVSENNDWEGWCLFFLEAIEQQAKRNLAFAESVRLLYEEMKQTFAEILSLKWSLNALDFVFTNPVFRNNKFTTHAGIPSASAARFTRIMLDKNIIVTVEEASGRRPAMYSFEPLMNLVRV
jgi:Fic family protein